MIKSKEKKETTAVGLLFEAISWKRYTKKCKHCGKHNTYRMKHMEISTDVKATFTALKEGMRHTEKRFKELTEAKK